MNFKEVEIPAGNGSAYRPLFDAMLANLDKAFEVELEGKGTNAYRTSLNQLLRKHPDKRLNLHILHNKDRATVTVWLSVKE